MVNRAGNPASLGVTRLGAGEITRTFRARARDEVWEWAAKLTTEQRGQIFTEAFMALETGRAEDAAPDPTPVERLPVRDLADLKGLATLVYPLPDPLPDLNPVTRLAFEEMQHGLLLLQERGKKGWRYMAPDGTKLDKTAHLATVMLLVAARLLARHEIADETSF